MICSTEKRFLGISAPFKIDPDANSLTQQMEPVKGAGHSSDGALSTMYSALYMKLAHTPASQP
jgi:hypothetical protein